METHNGKWSNMAKEEPQKGLIHENPMDRFWNDLPDSTESEVLPGLTTCSHAGGRGTSWNQALWKGLITAKAHHWDLNITKILSREFAMKQWTLRM